MWSKLGLLAVAGLVGTLSRYWVSGYTYQIMGSKFAWGTLAVNVIGCFLFGLIAALADERMLISTNTRFIILTGFMGAFTTFSTFSFETMNYVRDSQFTLAFLNIAVSCLLGFGGIISGTLIARII